MWGVVGVGKGLLGSHNYDKQKITTTVWMGWKVRMIFNAGPTRTWVSWEVIADQTTPVNNTEILLYIDK